MKKTIQPAKKEISELWCDGSGEDMPEGMPPLTVTMSFGFGSRFDGAEITLHYSEPEAEKLLQKIREGLCEKSLRALEEKTGLERTRRGELVTKKSKLDCELEKEMEMGEDLAAWGRNPDQELDGSDEIDQDPWDGKGLVELEIENLILYAALLQRHPEKKRSPQRRGRKA
jgi:hypothetical protein